MPQTEGTHLRKLGGYAPHQIEAACHLCCRRSQRAADPAQECMEDLQDSKALYECCLGTYGSVGCGRAAHKGDENRGHALLYAVSRAA